MSALKFQTEPFEVFLNVSAINNILGGIIIHFVEYLFILENTLHSWFQPNICKTQVKFPNAY